MPTVSGFYSSIVVGALRAPGQIESWNRNQLNPSGLRHHESGHYKPAAKIIPFIGGFKAQMESGVALNFGEIAVPDPSGFATETAVVTFNLGEVNSHPSSFFDLMVAASSVGTEFKAFNCRLWQGTLSAFSGLPQPTFYYRRSAEWLQGYIMGTGDAGVSVLPSSFPDTQNIFSKSPNTVFVSGCFKESEYTHFVYIRGFFPSGTYVLGTFGGLGMRNFQLKFSYDYTGILANVLQTDL